MTADIIVRFIVLCQMLVSSPVSGALTVIVYLYLMNVLSCKYVTDRLIVVLGDAFMPK